MARKKLQEGEVNKSQAIRELLKEKPDIKAKEAISALAEKGITIKTSLFYIVKGKVAGRKSRRRKNKQKAVKLMTTPGAGEAVTTLGKGKTDALSLIQKIKGLAAEVGGFRTLSELVEALSE